MTDREKQKYKNIHLLKRGGFTKKFYEDTEYKILAHFVHDSVQYFQTLTILHFGEVSETGRMNAHNLPIPHQQLLQHLDLLHNIQINLHLYYLFINQLF